MAERKQTFDLSLAVKESIYLKLEYILSLNPQEIEKSVEKYYQLEA